ncbi:hypothetical protein C8J57DRAFT_1492661 [Mycena rebaudengoi]|nr:hypothetical protein C8J57DRAFT_1492661 [Mycena rebaudengoi]
MSLHCAVYSSDNGREAKAIHAGLKALLARDECQRAVLNAQGQQIRNPHSDAPAPAPHCATPRTAISASSSPLPSIKPPERQPPAHIYVLLELQLHVHPPADNGRRYSVCVLQNSVICAPIDVSSFSFPLLSPTSPHLPLA